MTALGWLAYAGCRGQGALFFGPENETAPAKARRERQAKACCYGCPVLLPCRLYALASGTEHGVWGALTEEERASERSRLADVIAQDGAAA